MSRASGKPSLWVLGCFSLALLELANQNVGGATNAPPTSVQNVRVNHGRANVAMAQPFLHGANVVAVGEQVRGKGMPEGVAGDPFGESCLSDGGRHCSLNQTFIDVMTPLFASLRIASATFVREHELPVPLAVGVRVLTSKGMWQFHATVPIDRVLPVNCRNAPAASLYPPSPKKGPLPHVLAAKFRVGGARRPRGGSTRALRWIHRRDSRTGFAGVPWRLGW
jgi:hypothetical protein